MLILLIVAAAFGFRGHSASPREQVAAYIVQANKVEVDSKPLVLRIQEAYTRFSHSKGSSATQQHDLAAAREGMRTLRARIAALQPPADAKKLHALLLRLFDSEIAFAADVSGIAKYLPLLARAQAPLSAANRTLRDRVRAAGVPAEQARAFHDYALRTRALAAHVSSIVTPPLFKPLRDAEAKHMRDLSAQALQIETALNGSDSARATALFSRLVRIASTPSVAIAQRNAVLEYNRRLKAVNAVAVAVARERRRLDRRLA